VSRVPSNAIDAIRRASAKPKQRHLSISGAFLLSVFLDLDIP